MEQLPDLSTLSHAEKDHLLHALFDALMALCQDVAALQAENEVLQAEAQKLRGQQAKDRHNSSKPPSRNGLRGELMLWMLEKVQ
jgi:hypothetical protein